MGLALLAILSSCTQKQVKPDTGIDIDKLPVLNLAEQIEANVPDTFTWNSIQKKVTFIPLETTKASILGFPRLCYVDDGMILISDGKTENILLFNNEGKCISHFNHKGNGPGEYCYLSGIFFNSSDSIIQVYDDEYKKWLSYTSKGVFVRSLSTKDRFHGRIRYSKNNRIITRNLSGNARVSILDNDLHLIEEVFPYDPSVTYKEKNTIIGFGNNSHTKDIMLYNNSVETDTVYAFSDSNVWPLFIVDKGDYVIPKSERSDYFKAFLELNPTYPKDFSIDAFSNYVLMQYHYYGLYVAELWDLPSGKILSRCSLRNVVTKEKFSAGFSYTLPSGNVIHTLPEYVTQHRLVFVLSPEGLMDDIPGLKEDDNPVLMILEI
jgi:hypothetical protein